MNEDIKEKMLITTKYIRTFFIRFLKEYDMYNTFIRTTDDKRKLIKAITEEVYNTFRDWTTNSEMNLFSYKPSIRTLLCHIIYQMTHEFIDEKVYEKFETFYLKNVLKINGKEILNSFLKERKLKTKYYNYVKQYKNNYINNKKSKRKLNPKITLNTYISQAFFFDETNEGYEFWFNINNEWVAYYQNKYLSIKNLYYGIICTEGNDNKQPHNNK